MDKVKIIVAIDSVKELKGTLEEIDYATKLGVDSTANFLPDTEVEIHIGKEVEQGVDADALVDAVNRRIEELLQEHAS